MRNQPLILFFLLISIVHQLPAQENPLMNRWVTGANILYMGIDNELLTGLGIDKILSARSAGAEVRLGSDSSSLTVRPAAAGPVTVHIKTASDSLSVLYQSTYLPIPQISLGDVGLNLAFISTAQLSAATGLTLKGNGSDAGKIYEQCMLACFELQVGDKILTGRGNDFNIDILRALNRLVPGQKIIIRSLYLEPIGGGRPLKLEPAKTIVVSAD